MKEKHALADDDWLRALESCSLSSNCDSLKWTLSCEPSFTCSEICAWT